ncbi:hypothetical protein SAMN05660964_02334 [Thiothrix caldifontis]|uniref:Secreted protein n=1 Tax=Thiothrix caldifontis TaxID=525918 RepID=A0A1H4DPI8_9GAMM|nr:hypothetical protein [Thiothrix caldifontis]SEA74428.1 hypothetical protein SAMN05660964_02334 [Thiothrix caldifontis]
MKQTSSQTLAGMLVLLVSLTVSGCANFSETMVGAVSGINPFKQQTEAEAPDAAPINEGVPLAEPKSSIRVETKPPEPKGQQEVEVNVGNNKQCTTFCALPLRKPPASE